MRGQSGFWDIEDRYVRLSEAGDPLEKLEWVVPWGVFRKPLVKALKRSDGAKGGRPPYDAVVMFKLPKPALTLHLNAPVLIQKKYRIINHTPIEEVFRGVHLH